MPTFNTLTTSYGDFICSLNSYHCNVSRNTDLDTQIQSIIDGVNTEAGRVFDFILNTKITIHGVEYCKITIKYVEQGQNRMPVLNAYGNRTDRKGGLSKSTKHKLETELFSSLCHHIEKYRYALFDNWKSNRLSFANELLNKHTELLNTAQSIYNKAIDNPTTI